jgi:hypothetical protein
MIQSKKSIVLPEGTFNVQCDSFVDEDLVILREIYTDWRDLSNKLKSLNARSINLPEGLSEVAFCYYMDCVRLNNPKLGTKVNSSFDAYSLNTKKRIQIKACSVLPDLTSFGPKTQWCEIYFVDFYKEGKWDYTFDIYLIPNELIYSQKVNADYTMKEFQEMGKRPRFSIYESIIKVNNIQPLKTCNLNEVRAKK